MLHSHACEELLHVSEFESWLTKFMCTKIVQMKDKDCPDKDLNNKLPVDRWIPLRTWCSWPVMEAHWKESGAQQISW